MGKVGGFGARMSQVAGKIKDAIRPEDAPKANEPTDLLAGVRASITADAKKNRSKTMQQKLLDSDRKSAANLHKAVEDMRRR
jgi:non-homologous end joining protein Ku